MFTARSKRPVVLVSAISATGLLLAGCAGGAGDGGGGDNGGGGADGGGGAEPAAVELTEIVLTSQPNETGFSQWLAGELGFYEENGLSVEIEYAANGAAALAGGAAGDWQAGWMGIPPALTGFNTWGLLMAGPEMDESSNNVVWARTEVLGDQSVADFLQSARLGAPPNSMGTFTLYGCAAEHGVDPAALNLVNLDPPSVIQAMQSGELDGGASFSSVDYPLAQAPDEFEIICDLSETGTQVLTPWIVSPDFAGQEDASASFVEAVYRANEWIDENPDEAIEQLLEYYTTIGTDGDAEKAEYSLAKRDWMSLDEAMASVEDGSFRASIQTISEFFVANGVLATQPDVDQVLAEAQQLLESAQALRD